MNQTTNTADIDLDGEIEELAMKHIAVGWAQAVAINGHNPDYRQTAQFHRLKAFAVDLLARRSTSGSDEPPGCGWCNDAGILGSPPDRYEDCPYCGHAQQASGSDGTAAAGVESDNPYAATSWDHEHNPDEDDDATNGSELAADVNADYHYLLGLRTGWNLSQQRDVAGFNAALVSRQNSLDEAKAELRTLAHQAGAPAFWLNKIDADWLERTPDSNGQVTALRKGGGHRVPFYAAPAPAAQDERDVKDAARYRWLRDVCPEFEAMASPWLYDDLDKAIDAAMFQPKTHGTADKDGQC